MAHVVLLGTCDTKLQEILFLRSQILRTEGVTVTLIDVGRSDVQHEAINFRPSELRKRYGKEQSDTDAPRGESIKAMSACATEAVKALHSEGKVHGIIAAGGSGGTSLAAAVMRNALPIGFPKMIVSTVASGDTGPIVGETDITMFAGLRIPNFLGLCGHAHSTFNPRMYSVVDIAGLNQVLHTILSNAAAAISAMAKSYASRENSVAGSPKRRLGITMFGVTTPAVDAIRAYLESNYPVECYVFHATGHGGKAMERLIREGRLDAVLDLTTTEICDFHTGGVMSAGPHRLEAAAEAGIPNIISVGATDMTNFGPRSTVPERYKDRLLYEHNSVVTLMRSSAEECRQVGEYIVKKLRAHAKRPDMVEVWLPKGGVSMISTPAGPFEDVDADRELFCAISTGLEDSGIKVVEDGRPINDVEFAQDIAEALIRKMGIDK